MSTRNSSKKKSTSTNTTIAEAKPKALNKHPYLLSNFDSDPGDPQKVVTKALLIRRTSKS